jgi:hypothetical protein
MLVQFILRVTFTSHHLSLRLLRLKVTELTQDQGMPFKMGFTVFCGRSGFAIATQPFRCALHDGSRSYVQEVYTWRM